MKLSRTALIKILVFWTVFIIFHFAYRWLPIPLVAAFSGIDESFLQHAKIGFIAYSLASAWEVWVRRKMIICPADFVTSRVFTTLILPWVMFVLWYLAPNFYGRPMPTTLAEINYANVILLVMAFVFAYLERDFERVTFARSSRWLIASLYILALVQMMMMTFKLPWADFFRG